MTKAILLGLLLTTGFLAVVPQASALTCGSPAPDPAGWAQCQEDFLVNNTWIACRTDHGFYVFTLAYALEHPEVIANCLP